MATQPHLLLLQKTMVMVEGLATALDPQINMWDVAAPFVSGWLRDELGPEAKIADRMRDVTKTVLALPDLLARIEERFPPRGGAPEAPPLPDVPLIWERAAHGKRNTNHYSGYIAAALAGALGAWAWLKWGWAPIWPR